MASESKTVADIVKEMRGITSGEECCPDCGADFQRSIRWIEFADRIEAANGSEVDAILKDRDEMYKSERETIAKTNAWFEEYQTLKREVAELRHWIKSAARWIKCHDIYHTSGDDLIKQAKEILNDDGEFLFKKGEQ